MTRPTILRTTFWLSLSDGITLVAFAIVSILIARRLGAEQLGEYSMAMTIGAFVQIVSDGGYSISLARTVAQQPAMVGMFFDQAVTTKFWLWLGSVPLALGVASIHSIQLAALCAIVLVDVLASCISFSVLGALRGINHYVMPQLISSAYSLGSAVGASAALYSGVGIWGTIAIIALVGLCRAGQLLWLFHRISGQRLLLPKLWSRHVHRNLWQHLTSHWRLWLVNISSSFLHRAPLIVLGLRGGSTEVGYFSAAFRIYSAMRIVPGALFNVALPLLVTDKTRHAAIRILAIGGIIGLLSAGILWIGAAPLITTTFGLEGAVMPLQWMAVAFLALSLKTAMEAVLIARMDDNIVAAAVLVATGMTAITVWLIPPTAQWFSFVLIGSEWFLFVTLAWRIAATR